MNIDALSMMTLQELQDGFANRWITPLEVMQLTFQQIEAGDWNAARTLEIASGIERGVAFCRALMEGVDFLLTPVMPLVNFAAERRGSDPAMPLRHTTFTAPFNQSGHPAVTICGGFDARGLPVGVQLVGHRLDDYRLLDLAAWLEAHLDLFGQTKVHWPTRPRH